MPTTAVVKTVAVLKVCLTSPSGLGINHVTVVGGVLTHNCLQVCFTTCVTVPHNVKLTWTSCPMYMCRPTFDRIMQFLERAGLPQQPADQQQQQDEGSGGQQVLPEVLADPDQASMSACSPGEHASRKPSKDIDWSEISYGGSRHNGGWS